MPLHNTESQSTRPDAASLQGAVSRVRNSIGAAQYIGVSDSLLRKMRMDGTGPQFLRLSENRVGYLDADLDAWLDSRPRAVRTAEKEAA